MDSQKRKRLEQAGWRVGSASEFLGLSDGDAAFIEVKLALSRAFALERARQNLTQVATAKVLRSSQSRVAKMEAGDPSVSTDLLIRSLLALGATPAQLAESIAGHSIKRSERRPAPRARPLKARAART